MQFKDWATSKKLTKHTSSHTELTDLLTLADNRLSDCEKMLKSGVSPDTCFANVYEAALPCAKAILAASGYRTDQGAEGGHDLLFQALSFTVDTKDRAVSKLQTARKRRQQIIYTSVANLDQETVEKLLELVKELRRAAEVWLKTNHADLMTPPKPKATPAAPVSAAPSAAPPKPTVSPRSDLRSHRIHS
jgi:uncharacterized protein (UPF0332 family)